MAHHKNWILSFLINGVICSVGVLIIGWAWGDPHYRNAEGFLAGEFCLQLSIGVALIVVGLTVKSHWRRFGFWLALALVGQAIALQMIEAGTAIRYQHYMFLPRLVQTHPFLLGFFVFQALLVVMGFKACWLPIREWVKDNVKMWQFLMVGGVFVFGSATVSRDYFMYGSELFFAALIQTVNLGTVVLMAWNFPVQSLERMRQNYNKWLGRNGSEIDNPSRRLDPIAIGGAIWVIVLASLLGYFSYEHHPHIPDEVVYLYHARYFANGMLAMPAPTVPEAFSIDLMHFEADKWYSPVPPGWPSILAIGAFLGYPWVVNPFLAGLNILLTFYLVQNLYDRVTARMVVLLLCLSPWFVFMGMNLMNHMLMLTCALASCLAIVTAKRTSKVFWASIGGLTVGLGSLTRPLEGLVLAGLLGLWILNIGIGRFKYWSLCGFVLSALLVGAVTLPYNYFFTGDPLKFPIMAYVDKYYTPGANSLGFGPDRGLGWVIDPYPGHGLLDAIVNINLNTTSINFELFGWSMGSLLLMAILIFSGSLKKNDYLMLIGISGIIGIYTFYWFSGGPDFGGRYWFLTIVPLVILSVRGANIFEKRLRDTSVTPFQRVGIMNVTMIVLSLMTLVNYFPWRAIDKYHHYRNMRPDIRRLAENHGFGKSLVLIQGDQDPDYASAAVYNSPDLQGIGPIYAWDRNPEVRNKVIQAYPNRPIWIIAGPSITHGGFQLIKGPLAPTDLVISHSIDK